MKNKGFTYTVPSDKKVLTPFFPEVTNFRYIEGFKSGRLRGTRMDFQSETVSYNYPQVTLRKTCGNGGKSCASGVYYYKIAIAESTIEGKIVVIH